MNAPATPGDSSDVASDSSSLRTQPIIDLLFSAAVFEQHLNRLLWGNPQSITQEEQHGASAH